MIAASELLRSVSIETSSLTRPQPRPVQSRDDRGEGRSERSPTQSATRVVALDPKARHAATDEPCPVRPAGPGVRVEPRVHRPEAGLVVLGAERPARRFPGHPHHGANRQPFERRHGRVPVEVVAVNRIHVVTQPHAGVGHRHPSSAERRADALQRFPREWANLGFGPERHRWRLCDRSPLQGRSQQAVIVVADGHHDRGGGGQRLAEDGERGKRRAEHVSPRPFAQLDHVPEQHQPVDVPHRREQPCLNAIGFQRFTTASEMQVGDDQRPQLGAP